MIFQVVAHLRDRLGSTRIVDDFAVWAWGEDWGNVPLSRLDDEWNKRHSSELLVIGSDIISVSLDLMIKLWRKHDAMKKNTIQGFVTARLGAEKADHFARYAWGDRYATAPASEFLHLWNERHGHQVRLYGHDEIEVDLVKMIALWQSQGDPVPATESPFLHTPEGLLSPADGPEFRRPSMLIGTKINLVILIITGLVAGVAWFVLH